MPNTGWKKSEIHSRIQDLMKVDEEAFPRTKISGAYYAAKDDVLKFIVEESSKILFSLIF